ncbi:MAG TPA: hypothetical protein VJG32_17890 [Anaerolineae bacterium]|nr:hypothetical protein [Anaerolineae bacterium]
MSAELPAIGAFIGVVITALIGFLNYRNSARKDAVALLQKEVERAHSRLEEIEAERNTLSDERNELRNQIKALSDEREKLKKHSADQDSVIVSLTSGANGQAGELKAMRTRVDYLEIVRGELLSRFDAVGREMNKLQLENGDLRNQNIHLQLQLDDRVNEIERLQARCFDLEQHNMKPDQP